MKLSNVKKAFIAIIVANIIWGAAAPIFKVSLTNIPPFTLAFLRFSLGAIVLLLFLGKKAKIPTKSRRDLFFLVSYALTGITFNIMFFFWGLQRTYSINSPIIASSGPILTFFLAWIFLHEPFNLKKLFGMLLGTAGIIVFVIEPILQHGVDGSFIGNMFLLIATLAAVIQTIIGKGVLSRFEPFAFTFWAFVIGAASFLPAATYEYLTIPNLYANLNAAGYMGIAYGAIFSSAMAYGLYAWGLSKITATDASLFTYIDPVIGTVLGAVFLKEPITAYFLGGAAMIFGGIFVAEGRLHYHPFHLFFTKKEPKEDPKEPENGQSEEKRPHVNKKQVLAAIFAKNAEPPPASLDEKPAK